MNLLIFGFGYSGRAIARAAVRAGIAVTATSRDPGALAPEPGVTLIPFAGATPAIAAATHLLNTAAPGEAGDPVISKHRNDISLAPRLCWLGYLSTTGVYGDRAGGWVDESTEPAPASSRGHRRVAAETAWAGLAAGRALDIFRLAGIYGPGRSPLDDIRAGTARRIVKPGHLFSRIHRDDIAAGVLAALRQDLPPGRRILNFADDEPAASADVVAEAARLLGREPPPATPFAEAAAAMSPMALSFWAENRRVANARTKAALGLAWRTPTYREGLAAILAAELAEQPEQRPPQ